MPIPPQSSKKARPHEKARRSKQHSQRLPAVPARQMSSDDLEKLRALLKEQFGGKEPRDFQVELVQAQEERRDTICQAATGMGKTAIAAGPYALEKNKGRVTFMISPLIGLQNEMAETFRKEYHVSAVAVNSAHRGCTRELMREIVKGKYQIVLISPEMLLSRRFVDEVLRTPELATRVYSVIVDEAHCISHWGALFRKKYASIGSIRVFLPRGTPFIALSASLTRRVTRDIIEKLQFTRSSYLHRNLGNDRPNVSLVVRAIHNPMNSYTDLDFIIPKNISHASDISKTWIYADNVTVGVEIIDHLRTLLPIDMHAMIRPYNAVHTNEYRTEAMQQFRLGNIRILVCTDAAGMGCNIPDIELVVQWKLPDKLSSFIQRAGRAARAPHKTGLAVLLVEPKAYTIATTPDPPPIHSQVGKARTWRSKSAKVKAGSTKKALLEYARAHGRFRGGRTTTHDAITQGSVAPAFNSQDPTEGLHLFIQATSCRRAILAEVFDNPRSEPSVPCCDICQPTLLDRTRPGIKKRRIVGDATKTLFGRLSSTITKALQKWRDAVLERDALDQVYLTPAAILPNDVITKLASLRQPLSSASIQAYLAPNWLLWPRYGPELSQLLLGLNDQHCSNAEPVAKSTLPAATPVNHSSNTEAVPSSADVSLPSKRPRTESSSGWVSTAPDKDAICHQATPTSHKRAKHSPPVASSSVQPPHLRAQIVDTAPRLSYYCGHCAQGYAPPASLPASGLPMVPPPTPSHALNWTQSPFFSYMAPSFGPPLPSSSVPHHPYALWGQIPMMPPPSWHPPVPQMAPNPSLTASQGMTESGAANFYSQHHSKTKKNT